MSFAATTWAIKQKLPALTKLVLILLADRHNGDTNRCDPSLDRIAEDCGMSKDSVRRHIHSLVDKQLLMVHERWNGPVRLTNFYSFNMDGVVASDAGGGSTQLLRGGSTQPPEPGSTFNQETIRGAVARVFDYYVKAAGKSHTYSFIDERKKKGVARFHECLKRTKNDLEKAEKLMIVCVDTMVSDPWRMGKNDRNRPFNDWSDHLFKSEAQLEKWLEEAQRDDH